MSARKQVTIVGAGMTGGAFEERGERELKGVGEPVQVWAVGRPFSSGVPS